jgi:hypothetical protein
MTVSQVSTRYQNAPTDFNRILQTTIQELSHSLNANRVYERQAEILMSKKFRDHLEENVNERI